MPTNTPIEESLSSWDPKDIANLAIILDLESQNPTHEQIIERIRWLYHSKTRHRISRWAKTAARRDQSEDVPECPAYEELLVEAAKKLKVHKSCHQRIDYETYIPQAVMVKALVKMSPEARHTFFTTPVDAGLLFEAAGIKDNRLTGLKTTAGAMAVANASGMAVYTGATTALGFVTHAVGITLPFAAYTGLTSTIGFVIGPAGWLALGTYGFFKVTRADWNKLMPALLFIIATNSRQQLAQR